MESKYLKQMQQASRLTLRGNRIIVELLPKEEFKTTGGLILAAPKTDHKSTLEANRLELGIVVKVGEGYFDEETGDDVAMDVKPGQVVALSRYGLRLLSNFPGFSNYEIDTMAICRDTDVQGIWQSIEDYQVYLQEVAPR